jgi:hypothetical protein
MNFIIKSRNLINLKNLIEIDDDKYEYFYKGKSIKFLQDGIFFIYLTIQLDELNNDINIYFLLNHKEICNLTKLNNETYVFNKIIKMDNNNIISFKNKTNNILKINNIKLNIHKL